MNIDLKKTLHTLLFGVGIFITSLPTFAAENPNPDGSAVILLYHRFGQPDTPSTNIRLDQFDAQLTYLKQHHFHVWSLSRLVDALKTRQPIPENTVVLTVDDAWRSVYTQAYPRLKALGWPLTVFVNTDPVDAHYQSNMTWDQMREMQQHGVEFANHSKSHDSLVQGKHESFNAWKNRVQQEIETAQRRLQQELGTETNHDKLFSYPYGEYSQNLVELVAEMGYTAVAQNSGAVGYVSDLRALMRFPMSEAYAKLSAFKLKVNAQVLPITKVMPVDPVVSINPPVLQLFFDRPQSGIQCFNHKGERLNQTWITPLVLQIQDKQPLAPPRDRYACTQPTKNGQWRWFSHSWVLTPTNPY